MNSEYTGFVIDALSRQQGCPDAVGYIRPLRGDDIEEPGATIDPRWVWVDWCYTPDEAPAESTVGWREGDAVFVPADAVLGASEYDADGPRGRWMLAENPNALVIMMPEADGKRTLAVLG